MSQPHTTLSKPEHDRTAQQWAWQFLRRNPEYVAAYELLSSLTQEQLNQLSCLVARCKGLLLSEDLLNESVIGTLDLRFFDDKYGGFKYEVQHGLTRRETPRGVS